MNLYLYRKAALIASSALAMAASAHGFGLQVSAGNLADSTGQGLSAGSLVILVVDLGDDGVSAPTKDSFAPGSDDFILGSLPIQLIDGGSFAIGQINSASISLGSGDTLSLGDTPILGAPTLSSDDVISLFWFPEISQASYLGNSALTPGETSFGAYNTSTSVQDPKWTIPDQDSAVVPREALSQSAIGASGVSDSLLQARFSTVVVPEPSTSLLALLGASVALFRRRRQA